MSWTADVVLIRTFVANGLATDDWQGRFFPGALLCSSTKAKTTRKGMTR
jgi:hypothetical protein